MKRIKLRREISRRMGMNMYQEMAQRTSPDDGHDRIDNGVLGLIGETGEIVDLYKKIRISERGQNRASCRKDYGRTRGCDLVSGRT